MDGGDKIIYEAKTKQLKPAYLVTGIKQSVLNGFAQKMLLYIYCETASACGHCSACKKIMAESAVDVFSIRPEKGTIKVGQIRALKAFLYEKPFEADTKAVMIYEADKMTPSAQNALLKPLEQPPSRVLFFLFSQSDYGILPTVISRCENVRLRPPAAEIAKKRLANQGIAEARVALLLRLSNGYVDEAIRLNDDQAFFETRAQTFKIVKKLLDQKTYAVTQATDFFEKNKESIDPCMDMMKLYFMDILKVKYQTDAYIVNVDENKSIAGYADFFTTAAIYNMIETLLEYEQRLMYNVNFRLTIESMLFDILKEKYRW